MSKQGNTTDRNVSLYSDLYRDARVGCTYEVRNKVSIVSRLGHLRDIDGKVVLELGFGSGDLLHSLFSRCRGGRFVGVEIVRPALDQYAVRFPNDEKVSLLVGDVCRLPLRERLFDVVVCSHVLEHVHDDRAAVHEIRRMLRPRGLAVIAVPVNDDNDRELHCRRYDEKTLRDLFNVGGMECLLIAKHGSWLSRCLLGCIKSLAGGSVSVGESGRSEQVVSGGLRRCYHRWLVPVLLLLDRLDDLMARIDPHPTQVVAVFSHSEAAFRDKA